MKKMIICLLAVTMTVCSGCAEKETGADNSSSAAVSSEALDGKFNFSDAVNDMSICGNAVSLPCTFKELGDGFKYDSPIEDSYNNYMFTTLRYGDTDIGTIYLELRDDGKYDDAQIVSLVLNHNSEALIKGAGVGSSEEDIRKAIGDDPIKNDLNIDYGKEGEGFIRILLSSVDNKGSSITVMMPRE